MKMSLNKIVLAICGMIALIALLFVYQNGSYAFTLHKRVEKALSAETARLPFPEKLESKQHSLFGRSYCDYDYWKVKAYRCDLSVGSLFGTNEEVIAASTRIDRTMLSLGWKPLSLPYTEENARKQLARGYLAGNIYSKHTDGLYLEASFSMYGPEENLSDFERKAYQPYSMQYGHVFNISINADMVDSY